MSGPQVFEQLFSELMDGSPQRGDLSAIGWVIFPLRDKYRDEQYPH